MRTRFPATANILKSEGAQRFQLLGADEVATVLHELSTHAREPEKMLERKDGNGHGGCYAALSKPLPAILQCCMDAACEWIIEHAGPLKDVKVEVKDTLSGEKVKVTLSGEQALRGCDVRDSKALLLRYGRGGINYAHKDAMGDFQALLMLSTPGVDYTGGTFYLGNDDPPFETRDFPFQAAGELLVFRGRQGNGSVAYLHGMREVGAGTGAETRRFAVGLFQ